MINNEPKIGVARIAKLASECYNSKAPEAKLKPKKKAVKKAVITSVQTLKSPLKYALRNAPKLAACAVDKPATKAVTRRVVNRVNKPVLRSHRNKAAKECDVLKSNKRIRKVVNNYVPKVR